MNLETSDDDWDLNEAPESEQQLPLRRKKKKRKKKFKPKPLGNTQKQKNESETSATQHVDIPINILIVIILTGVQIAISAIWLVGCLFTGNGFAMGSLFNIVVLGLCIAGLIMRSSEARLLIIVLAGSDILFSTLRLSMLYFVLNAAPELDESSIGTFLMVTLSIVIAVLIAKIILITLRDKEGYFID